MEKGWEGREGEVREMGAERRGGERDGCGGEEDGWGGRWVGREEEGRGREGGV